MPQPRSLTEEVPTLPKPFSLLVGRCLALAPEERPTAAELAEAFDKLAAEKEAG